MAAMMNSDDCAQYRDELYEEDLRLWMLGDYLNIIVYSTSQSAYEFNPGL